MKNLPPIPGLLIAASLKRGEAQRKAVIGRRRSGCPQESHDNAEDAVRCANEAAKMEAHATENADMITQIEVVITFLKISKHGSAERTLAMRDLERSSMRLRREIGDLPVS